jgi:transcription elongation factor Elf1
MSDPFSHTKESNNYLHHTFQCARCGTLSSASMTLVAVQGSEYPYESVCPRCLKSDEKPVTSTITFTTSGVDLTKATKHDGDKVPVELLPSEALEEIAKVLAFGKKKYDAWNWAKGFKWTRLIGAAIRHLYAYQRGEDKDPESGLSHIAHAGCCILFLLQYDISKLGEDDRYKGFKK